MQNGSGLEGPLLIDTHCWIWYVAATRERLTDQNVHLIREAAASGRLLVSAISVWEIAMLESKNRIQLQKPCGQWAEQALTMPGLSLAPLSPAIAIESNYLPGDFHGDPADRIIVATARVMGARLLTSDKDIRAYGRHGYLLLA
ncbi:MAG TPA: type II toxin-antitoxin system VapC family toxin [Bryobacteraceae bacterium]|nr:type II toxin-antitoxin system VapC family toxin [Bryobacteraceae bacterium]